MNSKRTALGLFVVLPQSVVSFASLAGQAQGMTLAYWARAATRAAVSSMAMMAGLASLGRSWAALAYWGTTSSGRALVAALSSAMACWAPASPASAWRVDSTATSARQPIVTAAL